MKYEIVFNADNVTQGAIIRLFREMRDVPRSDDYIKAEDNVRVIRAALKAEWLKVDTEADVLNWHPRDVSEIAKKLDDIYQEAMKPDPKLS